MPGLPAPALETAEDAEGASVVWEGDLAGEEVEGAAVMLAESVTVFVSVTVEERSPASASDVEVATKLVGRWVAKESVADVELLPAPSTPPVTPAATKRAPASVEVSQAMEVPALFTSGRAAGDQSAKGMGPNQTHSSPKHWRLPPPHGLITHLLPTHWPKPPSTQAWSPSLQLSVDLRVANLALSTCASRPFCFLKSPVAPLSARTSRICEAVNGAARAGSRMGRVVLVRKERPSATKKTRTRVDIVGRGWKRVKLAVNESGENPMQGTMLQSMSKSKSARL
jgi:hypothetical protein